jgi:hypothetical protein
MVSGRQSERLGFLWPIRYEREVNGKRQAKAGLCLNVGPGGMLLLLNETPQPKETLQLHIRGLQSGSGMTRAEVRWTKPGQSWLKASALAGVQYIE